MLLLLAQVQEPHYLYQAKFVPLRGQAAERLDIRDAKRDLSAIGFTVSSGSDWVVPNSLYVIKGVHKGPDDHLPKWTPYALVKGDLILAKDKNGEAAAFIVQSKRLLRSRTTERAQPEPKIASTEMTRVPFREEWRPREYVSEQLTVNWYKLDQWEIGDASYRYGDVNMLYPNAYRHFPVLRQNGEIQKLGERVRGAEDINLGEVGFVSPEGWLVVRGTKKSKDGLIWLYRL